MSQAGLRKNGWVWPKTGWEACPEVLADYQKIPVQMKRRVRRAGEGIPRAKSKLIPQRTSLIRLSDANPP
jgi:hypothetical protein